MVPMMPGVDVMDSGVCDQEEMKCCEQRSAVLLKGCHDHRVSQYMESNGTHTGDMCCSHQIIIKMWGMLVLTICLWIIDMNKHFNCLQLNCFLFLIIRSFDAMRMQQPCTEIFDDHVNSLGFWVYVVRGGGRGDDIESS